MASSEEVLATYDVPVNVPDLEEWFQPDEWIVHKELYLNFMDIRYDFFQENDVLVACFPRSGTHLCWHIINLLIHGADFESNEYTFDDFHLVDRWVDYTRKQSGPVRAFHTHMKPCELTHTALLSGNRRVVHMIRNPKDTALSLYNVFLDMPTYLTLPKSFEDFATAFYECKTQCYGHSWVHHTRAWEEFAKKPGAQVLSVTFEDFIKDKRSVIERIAMFLKLDRSPEEIKKIAQKLAFSNMKNFRQRKTVDVYFRAAKNEDASYYKRGKIGSWKDAFTVALSEQFDAELKKRMEGSKLYSLYY